MTYKEIKRAQRRMLVKALDDFYDQCENDDLSTLTLELNYNPYNMGHKITTTYQNIGYAERYPDSDNGKFSS